MSDIPLIIRLALAPFAPPQSEIQLTEAELLCICAACNGSGEGRHEGNTCYACKGMGEINTRSEE